jgi:hypothetical protein
MTSSGSGRFVVKTAKRADDASASDAEQLTDELVVVTAPNGRTDKESWQRLLGERDDADWIQPVLVDDDGNERFPTGELTLRFEEPPTDDELQAFARSRHLRPQRRNTYQPAQVVLVPDRPRDVYLPELCAELERAPGVARAWPNTLSHYSRN